MTTSVTSSVEELKKRLTPILELDDDEITASLCTNMNTFPTGLMRAYINMIFRFHGDISLVMYPDGRWRSHSHICEELASRLIKYNQQPPKSRWNRLKNWLTTQWKAAKKMGPAAFSATSVACAYAYGLCSTILPLSVLTLGGISLRQWYVENKNRDDNEVQGDLNLMLSVDEVMTEKQLESLIHETEQLHQKEREEIAKFQKTGHPYQFEKKKLGLLCQYAKKVRNRRLFRQVLYKYAKEYRLRLKTIHVCNVFGEPRSNSEICWALQFYPL